MAENTDGAPVAEQAGTGEATEQQPTQTPSDTGGNKGFEARVDGLTAQLGRKNEEIDKLRSQLAEVAEKNKSDFQKQVEEAAQSLYGDKLQRLETLESRLAEKRDAQLTELPEEYRGLVDDEAPIERQLHQIELAQRMINEKRTPGGVDSGGNPPQQKQRTITWADYERVSKLGGSFDPEDRKKYQSEWPEIKKALQEGRITQ